MKLSRISLRLMEKNNLPSAQKAKSLAQLRGERATWARRRRWRSPRARELRAGRKRAAESSRHSGLGTMQALGSNRSPTLAQALRTQEPEQPKSSTRCDSRKGLTQARRKPMAEHRRRITSLAAACSKLLGLLVSLPVVVAAPPPPSPPPPPGYIDLGAGAMCDSSVEDVRQPFASHTQLYTPP